MQLEVPEFISPPEGATAKEHTAAVIFFLEGVAFANNIEFTTRGAQVFLRSSDIPRFRRLPVGFTSESFDKTVSGMSWDRLELGGETFFEVPNSHAPYLDQLAQVEKESYRLEFNLVTYSSEELAAAGVDLDTFLELNVDYFDSFNLADVGALDRVIGQSVDLQLAGGLRLGSRRDNLSSILDEVTTTTLSGDLGAKLRVALADEIPYATTTTNNQGVEVQSNIDFVEAGFSVTVEGRKDNNDTVFKFALENSSADFTREVEGLPVIRRRVSESIVRLDVGEVREISRIRMKSDESSERKRLLGRRDLRKTDSVVSVFVKRVAIAGAPVPRAIPIEQAERELVERTTIFRRRSRLLRKR